MVKILVFKIKDAGSIPASLVRIIKDLFEKLFFKKKHFNFLHNSLKKKKEKLNWNNFLKIKFTNYKYIFFTKNFFYKKNLINIFFLRKTKYFNKGRYSRNRQIYRTGVYLCFYINIIVLYFLWFFFYKFSIKFTYLWWLFYVFISSFIFSKSIKYNFFYPKEFVIFFKSYVNWILIILKIKK